MKKDIQEKMEDPRDLGLRSVMGSRFRDLSEEKSAHREAPAPGKPVSRMGLVRALPWALATGVLAWWYAAALLAPEAAVPAMVVCSCVTGFCAGKKGESP